MKYKSTQNTLKEAKELDKQDPLSSFRKEFVFPVQKKTGEKKLYFAGHSLGLMSKKAREYVNREMDVWANRGIDGYFEGEFPWKSYHENLTPMMAELVGAREKEVVVMNTLTANLHFMLVSFYRPSKTKYKILIENTTFPSDRYAVASQARFHGFDPEKTIVEIAPRDGENIIRHEDILKTIEEEKGSLALVLLGNANYLTGQVFDMKGIVEKAHEHNIFTGFNLAHGAGNFEMSLHDNEVDFAVWCSYKYLNSGPGSLGAIFVHENHLNKVDIPRFEGWWGHNKETRFLMGPNFDPIPSAEAWQLSCPVVLSMSAIRASMDIFKEAGLKNIFNKSKSLTSYLEFLLEENCHDSVQVVTPPDARGCMLCLKLKKDPKLLLQTLGEQGAIIDFREPDVLRVAPAPLYNSYEDVFRLVQLFKNSLN